ncbi:MAG: HAMP domain-containing histidine kinase [Labilithrix sp.]|nr:HAMP domain-containing histidine kinase [Labilithrix sp.]MCW5812549.1 HAMP domain-containing histidine kinase [Labilithrix sp.]
MQERGIVTLGRFARIVSDASGKHDVLALLADALAEHVACDAVAVYSLAADGKLRLAAARGEGAAAEIEVDLEDVGELAERVLRACGDDYTGHVQRPLVAGAALYGAVVLLRKRGGEPKLELADGLVDLAAMALGTAAHVEQLERQFAELRAQQEMLARTEKLRALGQMAAGISHDLKNILNPLSLHLQVIAMAMDRGKTDDAKSSIAEMKGTLQRGVQTIERLRDFSRQQKETKGELVDLDALAREAAAIGKARAASGSGRVPRIREELSAPRQVWAIGGEIVSALVNLVVNAIDAMAGAEKAGTITLRSGEDEGGSWIEVSDDGPGMPAEVAKRVFEPFFTTKGQEGTGLGLAMVYATMQRHGGSVTLDTAPDRGTTFRLRLPAASPLSGR